MNGKSERCKSKGRRRIRAVAPHGPEYRQMPLPMPFPQPQIMAAQSGSDTPGMAELLQSEFTAWVIRTLSIYVLTMMWKAFWRRYRKPLLTYLFGHDPDCEEVSRND